MLVKRDPFARQELHRERVYDRYTCAWCGQTKRSAGRRYVYRFWIETDGGRKFPDTLVFCSVECRNTHMRI